MSDKLLEAAKDVVEAWTWWTIDEYDRDRSVVSDAIVDLKNALADIDLQTCPNCMGSGCGGHPDSRYLCYLCGGSGGIAPQPDA